VPGLPTPPFLVRNQNTPQESWEADRKTWDMYPKLDWFRNQEVEPDLPHTGRSILFQWLHMEEGDEGRRSWICRVPLDTESKWCDHGSFDRSDRAIAHVRMHLGFEPFPCKGQCGKEEWYALGSSVTALL
jgi:hypothetical protein